MGTVGGKEVGSCCPECSLDRDFFGDPGGAQPHCPSWATASPAPSWDRERPERPEAPRPASVLGYSPQRTSHHPSIIVSGATSWEKAPVHSQEVPEATLRVGQECPGVAVGGLPLGPGGAGVSRPLPLETESQAALCLSQHPPPSGASFDVPDWQGWGSQVSSGLFEASHCPVAPTQHNRQL